MTIELTHYRRSALTALAATTALLAIQALLLSPAAHAQSDDQEPLAIPLSHSVISAEQAAQRNGLLWSTRGSARGIWGRCRSSVAATLWRSRSPSTGNESPRRRRASPSRIPDLLLDF